MGAEVSGSLPKRGRAFLLFWWREGRSFAYIARNLKAVDAITVMATLPINKYR